MKKAIIRLLKVSFILIIALKKRRTRFKIIEQLFSLRFKSIITGKNTKLSKRLCKSCEIFENVLL